MINKRTDTWIYNVCDVAIASLIHSYFDNVMTKFTINNRTDAWKTDVNSLNCPFFWKLQDRLYIPGARFSKTPETFRARKASFCSSVSKTGEVYTPETWCIKGTSVHSENMWIKQLCNHKVRDFAMAFRLWKLFGTFEKWAPGQLIFFFNLPKISSVTSWINCPTQS